MGITGLSLGLSQKYGISCCALLADTFAGQMHIGMRESKELLKILDKRYKFGVNFKDVDRDIAKFEKEIKPFMQQVNHASEENSQDTSYIG
jgi:proteasome assembly chaperone (PAC2) family protein